MFLANSIAPRRGTTAISDLRYPALGLGFAAVYAAMAAVLFGAAGTLAVPMSWAYLALFAVLCAGASAAIYLQSPDLVKRPGEGEQDRMMSARSEPAHVLFLRRYSPVSSSASSSTGSSEMR